VRWKRATGEETRPGLDCSGKNLREAVKNKVVAMGAAEWGKKKTTRDPAYRVISKENSSSVRKKEK